ncbi:MAG: hypothetical protein HOI95_19890 [Chromatiales bacterium]|jgi:hypothetical protein|nr:hypothetical protein [Chromatiales bacterium]
MIVSQGFWRVLWRHPTTYAAIATVVASVWGFHNWFSPPWFITLAAGAVGAVLLAIWPPLFARSSAWAAAQRHATDNLDRLAVERIQSLEQDLRKLGAQQAIDQLRGLRDKLASLTGVIEHRLNAGELTFSRYLNTAKQVYLSAVDNLQEVVIALTSIDSLDRAALSEREQALHQRPDDSSAVRELESVQQRVRLLDEQNAKVAGLLADNEAAMTALTNTAAALADVVTKHGHATVDAPTAMAELEALASRASSLGRSNR